METRRVIPRKYRTLAQWAHRKEAINASAVIVSLVKYAKRMSKHYSFLILKIEEEEQKQISEGKETVVSSLSINGDRSPSI